MTAVALLALTAALNVPAVPSGWRVGFLAFDLETGGEVLSRNADALFRPASTVKVLTTVTALEHLGASYVFRTSIQADTSQGCLWLVGAGAPLLSAEDVTRAAMETVAALPAGRTWSLYLDAECFFPETHLLGWDESDWDKTYCPPVEPVCIGDNVLQIVVSAVGGSVRVFSYPRLPGLVLSHDEIRIGNAGRVTASVSGWDERSPRITLGGTVASNETTTLYKPFAGAPVELAGYLGDELGRWGMDVRYAGQGTPGDGAFTTATMLSQPLWVLLGSMNKFSRNVISELLLRGVCLETSGAPASTRAGCDISGRLLDEILPGVQGWQLADGSGLSRLNLLTPRQLATVFAHGARSMEFGPEFVTSFPVNGVDGTLFSRLRNLPPGAFRGKTGTLNDTCTITGVLTAESGRRIALAIMLEVPRGTAWSARAWQDSLISAMYAEF